MGVIENIRVAIHQVQAAGGDPDTVYAGVEAHTAIKAELEPWMMPSSEADIRDGTIRIDGCLVERREAMRPNEIVVAEARLVGQW